MKCRNCNQELNHIFLDLGIAPPTNAYLSHDEENLPEKKYPLKLFVCDNCWLVQTEDYSRRDELFTKVYAYFSSVSSSWLEHARTYSEMIIRKLGLNSESFVLELASNDGYLLKNFVAAGIPCLGVEPTDSTAEAAEAIGIPVLREFFGESLANTLKTENKQADLIIGNNVYAHVPDINDFTRGLKTILKKGGTITLEFPHLLNLIRYKQFDTVYHEHYSYLSLHTVQRIFKKAGLKVYDVEQLATHGGSLRVYGCHINDTKQISRKVIDLVEEEIEFGLEDLPVYLGFQAETDKIVENLFDFLKKEKAKGKTIAAYGAAAKGNTLLNYGKIGKDLISFICDAAPSKQNKIMPGNHIPILHPDALTKYKPDWVIIFPWNLKDEITTQHEEVYSWGGKFFVAIPELKVIEKHLHTDLVP